MNRLHMLLTAAWNRNQGRLASIANRRALRPCGPNTIEGCTTHSCGISDDNSSSAARFAR